MKKYEHLDAFQAAIELMVAVYGATESFPSRELYGLTSQMRRAAVSVVSHIAEGQGRLTLGEWRQMLSQARGSLFEVEAQTIASHRLKMLPDDTSAALRERIDATGRPLSGLIRYVKAREEAAKRKRS